jgi:glycine cleavage system H protein
MLMPSPADRFYLSSHEWHKAEGGQVVIGISQFAVDELTDITFLDITKTSGTIAAGDSFGEIESVKATSELYCGIDGVIESVNSEAIQNPGVINTDPFGRGWLIKVRPSEPSQLEALLSAAMYDAEHAAS